MKKNNYLLPFFCCFFLVNISFAQDIHFSQYYNSPLNINPALTGVFNGDMRLMGNYRNQWSSVPVDYNTFSAAYDMKYFHKKMGAGFFGGGIILHSDEAGDSELGMSQVAVSASYSQIINEYNIMTAGFQFGVGQRSFNTDNLQLGNQFVDGSFSSSASTKENFSNTNNGYIDISAGINWHMQFDEGLKRLDFGLGAFHLNKPQQKFYESDDVELPMRFSAYAAGEVQFNELWSGVFHGVVQIQGPYKEAVSGAGVKYWLNQSRGKEMAVQLGTAYRFLGRSDAIIPSFELHYLAWKFGLSYDINTSNFEIATNNRGGLELSLIYIFTKVKPTKEIKACPVF